MTDADKPASAHTAILDAISNALEEAAQLQFSLQLIRLVEGVYTYTLNYNDGSDTLEFSSTEEAYEHVANKKRLRQAQAVLSAVILFGWSVPAEIAKLNSRIDRLIDNDHRVRNAELRAIATEKNSRGVASHG